MNQAATTLPTTFHSNAVTGEVIKPLTNCKTHGAIYDMALVRKENDSRRKPGYFYYRCKECRYAIKRRSERRASKRVSENRIKDAIFARVQELTGANPVVTKVQKKVINMFLSINRSSKK